MTCTDHCFDFLSPEDPLHKFNHVVPFKHTMKCTVCYEQRQGYMHNKLIMTSAIRQSVAEFSFVVLLFSCSSTMLDHRLIVLHPTCYYLATE